MPVIGTLNQETVTVSSTAIGFDSTPASNNGFRPQAALITVEAASIRYTTDGTTPTTSVGHIAGIGDPIVLADPGEVSGFLAIRKDAGDATIEVSTGIEWRA